MLWFYKMQDPISAYFNKKSSILPAWKRCKKHAPTFFWKGSHSSEERPSMKRPLKILLFLFTQFLVIL